MKGVVLAGGKGTRLKSLTRTVNKHLLPVYNEPLIYWPVMTLVRIGISEIMIVSNPGDVDHYRALFGDGSNLGVSIEYAAQQEADGVAGALAVAEPFAKGSSVAVILGDNVFIDTVELKEALHQFERHKQGALLFLKEVQDPERFGVADVEGESVLSIEEKPSQPRSQLAVTGLYLYDAQVFDIVHGLKPSARGELEVTDINKAYLARGQVAHRTLRGAWIDAGTHESLLQANLVAAGMDHVASSKIKILFGINRLAVGGAEHLMLHQLAHINRERFEHVLVTLVDAPGPSLDGEMLSVNVPWQKFAFRGFFDVPSFIQLYRFLRRERFDVVITSLFFSNIMLRTAALLARVPVILVNEVNVKRERGERALLLERLLARYTSKFVANSKEVLEICMQRLQIPRERAALIYSAIEIKKDIDVPETERREIQKRYGVDADDLVITSAGRLVEQKGHVYLIDAFAKVCRAHPDVQLKLILFGEGELKDMLTSLAQSHGLGTRVMLPGVAPLSDILAITDLFVLPSLWEGMSLMLLEAMAARKPIIATDISGSRELITDNENGFLVPPGDSEGLAQKLSALIEDEKLREQFGRASVKEVQKFSIEHNLSNLYAVIHEALRLQRGTRSR